MATLPPKITEESKAEVVTVLDSVSVQEADVSMQGSETNKPAEAEIIDADVAMADIQSDK